ncbi:MAG: sigma-70 family RNA polymerase sigma factor [Rhodobacteraceae bacterium]|nr:sigma-70 family RNA polymerase sigma factor [Paracoccaceae bacterium]
MSQSDSEDEHALIRRISAGDKTAFRQLYDAYEKRVFFFIKRRLDDPHESADVFHEVMMDVWRKADQFEGRSKVSTWILGIAHNKSIDLLRKRHRREWDELDEEAPDDAPTAVDLMAAAGDAAIVRRCVDGLKPAAREAVTLVFFEGLKYREIAETMACAEGTIKARVHRAVKDIETCVRRCGLAKSKETAE